MHTVPIDPKRVINGTWGTVWIDGSLVAEAKGLQAKVTLEKADIDRCGTLAKGSKVTGLECQGTLTLHKVTSRFIKLLSDDIKRGRQRPVTIISKLDDPDAYGAERVIIKDAVFAELTLVDWEAKKNGEESIPFTFTDWDYLDIIDPDNLQ